MVANIPKTRSESVFGLVYAGSAFLIWGMSAVYWKALGAVPALEIIMHRVVWSFFFLVILIVLQRRTREFVEVLRNGRMLLTLFATAIFISGNWFLYIWAVNSNYLLQASLGYYINPLVNVVLGFIFLQERLRKPQILAVLLLAIIVLQNLEPTSIDILFWTLVDIPKLLLLLASMLAGGLIWELLRRGLLRRRKASTTPEQ